MVFDCTNALKLSPSFSTPLHIYIIRYVQNEVLIRQYNFNMEDAYLHHGHWMSLNDTFFYNCVFCAVVSILSDVF